jgi:hypothetical protein
MMRWPDSTVAAIAAVAGTERGAFAEFVREATDTALKAARRARKEQPQ